MARAGGERCAGDEDVWGIYFTRRAGKMVLTSRVFGDGDISCASVMWGMSKQGGKSRDRMRDFVYTYLKDLKIEDRVTINMGQTGLAAANVSKSYDPETETVKYCVNLAAAGMSTVMAQGVCDHEIGTHLLRMMNEDYQVGKCFWKRHI